MTTLLSRQNARTIARLAMSLADFDPADTARRYASTVDDVARDRADQAARTMNHWVDDGLDAIGLQRQPSTGQRVLEALGWTALGATAVGGAWVARRAMEVEPDRPSDAADEASDSAPQAPMSDLNGDVSAASGVSDPEQHAQVH